jgi:hypothetical protein
VCQSGDVVGSLLLWQLPSLSFNAFYVKIRFLQPYVLVTKDRKPTLLGVLLQPMCFQQLLDLVLSSEWVFILQSLVW